MNFRWGLGPVFVYEWRIASRRWQWYAARSLFVALLFVALTVAWVAESATPGRSRAGALVNVGEYFFYAIVGTQLALVLLAAPAATAGAICADKVGGSLTHLLTTDLSDTEIILGKLAARLVPVVGLVGCSLPVLALSILLGGVDPEAVFGAFLITLGVAVLGCTLAMTFSVVGTKTFEVLLATYLFLGLWLLAYLVHYGFWGVPPAWLVKAHPFVLAFAPYSSPGSTDLGDCLIFLGITLGISLALVGVAILVLRPAARRVPRGSLSPKLRLRVPSILGRLIPPRFLPSLDNNPLLWREWYDRRSSRWMRMFWLFYLLLSGGFCLAAAFFIVESSSNEFAAWTCALHTSIGLLLVSVTSVFILAEERTQGSLDLLLTTPLSSRTIFLSKWQGTFRIVVGLTLFPLCVAAASVVSRGFQPVHCLTAVGIGGFILAAGSFVTSLGLALALWVTRPGRAAALSSGFYLLITVGWLFVVLAIFRGWNEREFSMVSPLMGVGVMTADLNTSRGHFYWAFMWTVMYAAAALTLFKLSLASFDRCVGRVSDRPG